MKHPSRQYDQFEVLHPDYSCPITLQGVTVYPYLPATETEPAEEPWAEWDKCLLGGESEDCTDLLSQVVRDHLEQAILRQAGVL